MSGFGVKLNRNLGLKHRFLGLSHRFFEAKISSNRSYIGNLSEKSVNLANHLRSFFCFSGTVNRNLT